MMHCLKSEIIFIGLLFWKPEFIERWLGCSHHIPIAFFSRFFRSVIKTQFYHLKNKFKILLVAKFNLQRAQNDNQFQSMCSFTSYTLLIIESVAGWSVCFFCFCRALSKLAFSSPSVRGLVDMQNGIKGIPSLSMGGCQTSLSWPVGEPKVHADTKGAELDHKTPLLFILAIDPRSQPRTKMSRAKTNE